MSRVSLVLMCTLLLNYRNIQTITGDKGSIRVTVNNCRNNQGAMCFALYNNAEGFPGAKKAYKVIFEKIINTHSAAEFDHLPDGEYAVSVFHDENNNKIFDRNFIGIPKEGHGASNDAKGHFGPPVYSDAKFILKDGTKSLTIHLVY